MNKVSKELISQHFNNSLIHNFFLYHDKTDRWRNFRYPDLRIEPWQNCLWTNYGFISYRDFAEFLLECSENKSYELSVEKVNDRMFLVEGRIKSQYRVFCGECECMLYRQRVKRAKELPSLFKWFDRPFCHHTKAVEYFKNR